MRPRKKITTEMLAKRNDWLMYISQLTGIATDDIMGRCRKENIVIGRKLLAYALHVLEGYTTTEVGKMMGISHSSVTIHCNKLSYYPQSEKVQEWMRVVERYSKSGSSEIPNNSKKGGEE